jgi:hypothetical protein
MTAELSARQGAGWTPEVSPVAMIAVVGAGVRPTLATPIFAVMGKGSECGEC